MIADQLGLDGTMARRCGFLHDIGKAMDHDVSLAEAAGGGHAMIGAVFLKEHGEDEIVVNAVAAHHDEVKQNSVYAHLVIAGDAISGARPGARREILENYLKRIGELEELAMSYEGVSKAFAMQAGRELRVIVESEKVTDQYADDLSFMISQKIQDEMQYPGQIRVTVIREKRAVAYAR
jgi:ribonuclease Y